MNFLEGLSKWKDSVPSGVCGEVFNTTEGIVSEKNQRTRIHQKKLGHKQNFGCQAVKSWVGSWELPICIGMTAFQDDHQFLDLRGLLIRNARLQVADWKDMKS